MKIKVAIVEDDVDWVKAMVAFLESQNDIEISGTAYTRENSIELVKSTEIDVLLMDINLDGKNHDGIYAVLDILEIKDIKIIMLTSLKDEETIKNAFTAGASDYISKDNFYDLPYAIRRMHFRGEYNQVLLNEFQRLKREEQLNLLSPSEKSIFQYMEKGYTQVQIEKAIFKTRNTIKQQVRSILKKLNVNSSKDAVNKVNSRGLTKNSIK